MSNAFVVEPASREPAPTKPRKVFVTGAAGRIGSYFAEHAPDAYDLTLMVREEQQADEVRRFGEVVVADLSEKDRLKELLRGIDTVVHLAANPSPSATWGELLGPNIEGTYNLFVAAAAARCRRVVYASSIHAVSGYPKGQQVHTDSPVNPGDLYGVTKCFGEAMGRFMAVQHGLSVIAIRIGAFQPIEAARDAKSLRMMDAFVSHRDLHELLVRCIDNEDLRFAIVHGLSGNRFNQLDITDACSLLGYTPEDDFTKENPELRDLRLYEEVTPHDEKHSERSGLRGEL